MIFGGCFALSEEGYIFFIMDPKPDQKEPDAETAGRRGATCRIIK